MLEGGPIENATPVINEGFDGVLFVDPEYVEGDAAWLVPRFEDKSSAIRFVRVGSNISYPKIEQITLMHTPTMTFLNPRPAASSPGYPWRWDGGEHNHDIKLPLPLTYQELSEGSQIVVSGVTEALAVIEGVVEENNEIHFRAGGLLIASVQPYNGERDVVKIIVMEDFTGAIHAVNFDKAYKNWPGDLSMNNDEGLLWYWAEGDTIAKCIINGVVFKADPNYIPSNGLLGNLVFQSQYLQSYGNVIEAYYWNNERFLYVIRIGANKKIAAINQLSTNSPLVFPVF